MILGSRRFWLIALAALIVLSLKALLVTSMVAGRVEDAAVAALADGGISGVEYAGVDGVSSLGADGLDVVLEGPAAAETAAVAAVAGREEVSNVVYRVTGDAAPAEEAEPAEEPEEEPVEEEEPAAAAPAPALDPSVVTIAAAAGGAVVLTGEVADESVRDGLVAAAEEQFGAENVTDQLTIGDVAPDDGQVIVEGEATSNDEQVDWVAAATTTAGAAGFDVVDRTTVAPVADRLNELFALEPIEFDVSRATIRSESIPTLDAAAEAINASPDGPRLRVVGHTDGDGSEAANQSLSEARAAAVVDYLVNERQVDPDRLEAEGRGEAEPLVEPESTPEDKQRNRRIEWEPIS